MCVLLLVDICWKADRCTRVKQEWKRNVGSGSAGHSLLQGQRLISQGCCCIWGLEGVPWKVFPTPFGRVAFTNGRKGAKQENLDLISVSHSVCVLFSDFCWGQLRYKQMDFKVIGLNKNLHNILMVQVFWDRKTRLKISEGIYLCFLGQAERQEIDLVLFFWLIGLFVCFSSSCDFKILLHFL